MTGGWSIFLALSAAAMFVGGMIGTWFAATGALKNPDSRIWLVGLGVAIAVFGLFCLLSLFQSRVRLFQDRIEVEELTSVRIMKRDEIRGWRLLPTSPPVYVFEPTDSARRSVKVAKMFRLDVEFTDWVYSLPNLDVVDAQASKAEILSDTNLGATPGDRMETLARSKRIARVVNFATYAAITWGWFYPRPYELAIAALVVLPWIAVWVMKRSCGLIRSDQFRNDKHPDVAIPLIMPGMILTLRSVTDYNVIHSPWVAVLTMCIAGAFFLSTFGADSSIRGKVGSIIGLAVWSLAFGYGATVETNVLLEHSRGTGYPAIVEGKHVSTGKRTTYVLQLSAWGPLTKPDELEVSRATYEPIERGDTVCLSLRRGPLGVEWYSMRAWQRGGQPAACR